MLVGSSYAELSGAGGGTAPAPYVVVVVTVDTAGDAGAAGAASASDAGLPVGRIVGYSGPRTGMRMEPESSGDTEWLPEVVTGSGGA